MSGCEWVIEAHCCDPAALSDPARLRALFEALIEGLSLNPVDETRWHQFPGGGVTGLALLQESQDGLPSAKDSKKLQAERWLSQPGADGHYTITFGSIKCGDSLWASVALFDGVEINARVPEPSALLFAAMALADLSFARRHKMR